MQKSNATSDMAFYLVTSNLKNELTRNKQNSSIASKENFHSSKKVKTSFLNDASFEQSRFIATNHLSSELKTHLPMKRRRTEARKSENLEN
jgi:hypothetical protein